MHDGIHIEKEGTPSITICTDVFEITAKSMAEMWGANNYQILYTEHPISELNKEQLAIECNKFSKIILKKMFNAPYVKGAKKFLELSRKQNKIFLLSATPQIELEEILKFKKINNYFIEVCGSPKKKDLHLKNIIKKNNLNIDKSIFFGD